MERKVYEGNLKQLDEKGRGVAVIATLGVPDLDSDIVMPGALAGQTAPLLQSHDWTIPPWGKAAIREEGNKVLADFEINLGTTAGREMREVLLFDLTHPPAKMQWSWGFTVPLPDGSEMGEFAGQRVRRLKKVTLHEVSTVILGSSVGTRTLALKEDVSAATAAAVAAYEQLRTKMVIAEYERSREREQGQHGYKYMQLWANAEPYRTARSAAKHAARELGLKMPEIRIFTPCELKDADFTHDTKIGGFAHAGGWEIGIASNIMDERSIVWITAHEVKHLAGGSESEADEFADAFVHKAFVQKAFAGEQFGADPRPPGSWTGDQLVAAAAFVRHRGGF